MPVVGNFLTFVKDTVTILTPMKSSFVRGPASIEKQAPTFSIRMQESVQKDIEEAAKLLDMEKSAFMRWCSHAVAIEILKQKNEYDKEHSVD